MDRKYYIFIAIILIAIVSGIFAYPSFVNKGIDAFNNKFALHIWKFKDKPYVLGLDLQGGVSLTYQADLSSAPNPTQSMAGLRDIIERRVNMFGVSEPVVQIQGKDRLIVELPGVTDVQQAIDMIGQTPYLEFDEQRPQDESQKILDKIKEVQDAGKNNQDISKIKDVALAFENPYFKPTELTGKYLQQASVVYDQTTLKPQIQLKFNSDGAKIFEDVTARNVGKPLAIYLDGSSIIDTNDDGKIDASDLYAPVVQGKISGGIAVITGNLNAQTANTIVSRLNSGALPVKIGSPITQQTIGPSLGSVSLQRSLVASLYGFLAVAIFMILVYRLPGLLASLALLIYVAVNLSLFKLIPVTLSLASIGGFILSIGMAVDANILIFARMKEEIKAGRGLHDALRNGFRRAWPSIRDSNFNSLIVCLILFFFATSFIKGFALTLGLGILTSMLSAIFITQVFLDVFLGKWVENKKWLL